MNAATHDHRQPRRIPRDHGSPVDSLITIAVVLVLVLAIASLALDKIEQRTQIAELQEQIKNARLTRQQQCWTVGGQDGQMVVRLCATPWEGF